MHYDKSKFLILTSSCSYRPTFSETMNLLYNANSNVTTSHVGEPGRSNKWIAQSLINALETRFKDHPTDKIIVVASWSSVDRTDLVIDKSSNELHRNLIFKDYCDSEFFTGRYGFRAFKWYNDVLDKTEFDDTRQNGLLSITNLYPSIGSRYPIEDFVGIYLKYFYNAVEQFEKTLSNIVALQNYCKLRGITQLNLTWQDIWHDTSNRKDLFLSGLKYYGKDHEKNALIDSYKDIPLRIDNNPQFSYLYNQIDFSNWFFYRSDRCQTGGVADWCIENDIEKYFGGEKDPFHPTPEGYKEFVRQQFFPWFIKKTQQHNNLS